MGVFVVGGLSWFYAVIIMANAMKYLKKNNRNLYEGLKHGVGDISFDIGGTSTPGDWIVRSRFKRLIKKNKGRDLLTPKQYRNFVLADRISKFMFIVVFSLVVLLFGDALDWWKR